VVVEEVAVLVVLVRRHCHAVRAAVRRAVDDEISSAIKEETYLFAKRRLNGRARFSRLSTSESVLFRGINRGRA